MPMFQWRAKFFEICQKFDVKAADACVQFGLAVPGIVAVALNTGKPQRIKDNIASATTEIPADFWRELKNQGLIEPHFPIEN